MGYIHSDQLSMRDLRPTTVRTWWGTAVLPGETTACAQLVIVPRVIPHPGATTGASMRAGFNDSDGWMLIHTGTGLEVAAEAPMPLAWLRRYARRLDALNWNRVHGDVSQPDEHGHIMVNRGGQHVLDCWRRGVPIEPLSPSVRASEDDTAWQLWCANPQCEDALARYQAVLRGAGDTGSDPVQVTTDEQVPTLTAQAAEQGWRDVSDEHGRESAWLCACCAASHQPAPPEIASGLPHLEPRADISRGFRTS